ncbi:MAG: TraB/GumN family protein [Turneriella sp.]|nr:TraB/GumN family protein [Turneriella sp.]
MPRKAQADKRSQRPSYSLAPRRLRLGKSEILLLGTAHVSRRSVEDVGLAIQREKPDLILLELDEGRARNLRDPDHWKHMDIVQVIRSGKIYLLFSSVLLAVFQKKIGNRLDVAPGAEFLRAIELAEEKNIPYHFIDREIRITLRRAWQKLGFFNRMRLLSELFASFFASDNMPADEVEKLKERDVLHNLLEALPPSFRRVREVILDERDVFMAQKVRDFVRSHRPRRVLVVVGAGHLAGIEEAIAQEHQLGPLTFVQEGSKLKTALFFLAPIVLIAALLAYTALKGERKISVAATLQAWITIKCLSTALITLAWRPHPLAYLAGIVVSPVSTFLPIIKVGWVSALLEAIFRKPQVADFEGLVTATESFREFYRNRIFRIFMVFFIGQFSSALGYWLFLWYIG